MYDDKYDDLFQFIFKQSNGLEPFLSHFVGYLERKVDSSLSFALKNMLIENEYLNSLGLPVLSLQVWF